MLKMKKRTKLVQKKVSKETHKKLCFSSSLSSLMDSSPGKQKEGDLVETHFRKAYVTTSIDGAVGELPRHRLCVSSSDLKKSFSRISFNGFWSAGRDFKSWAKKMEALHEPIWRKAGIFEAIKASTYGIRKNQSLILGLVEKWCPETKSFFFPWGEATITLEDVLVLLGFSVLGSPVSAPLESSEMGHSVAKLEKARFGSRGHDSRMRQGLWISSFLGRGGQMEHEAFLVMWLSLFVFPDMCRRTISRKLLPIAVRLAKGERIALAPAVLARLYRDLGQIQAFAREKSTRNVTLKSLFKLVQVWAWERFRNTRPKARVREIPKGEPRIARWVHSRQPSEDVRWNLDDFDWRPYTKPLKNWDPPRFYPGEAMWMTTVDDNLDDEFVSFARCMRVSHLVGIGIVEDYYPNRVAMQFGLTQDLPGLVIDQRSFTEKEAWDDYSKPLDGVKLYMPSCLATTSVTERYQDWWLKFISQFLSPSESTETFNASNTIDDDDVQPLGQVLQKLGESFLWKVKRFKTRRLAENLRFDIKKDKIGHSGASASTELPLSQLFKEELMKRTSEHLRNKRSKRDREDDESSMDHKDDEIDDDITIAQISKSRRNYESGSKANKNMVQRPSNENNSSYTLVDSNGGIINIVVSPPETRQTCDDELHVNRTKEEECLVHEDGKMQRYNENLGSEAEKEEDINERLKQRKLSIKEIEMKVETRIMKVEKSLAVIRTLKTRPIMEFLL